MANGRIELKVGEFSFSSEGDETWVQKQFEAVMQHLEKLREVAKAVGGAAGAGGGKGALGTAGPLASFLKAKNATGNQRTKFLATSEWLHLTGKTRLTTGDVIDALSKNSQSALTNASQCLKDNVGKGFCEKDGQQYFVTDEGRTSLG